MPQRKDQLDAARARLNDVLQSMMDDLGPRHCAHGDWMECSECEFDDTKPVMNSMVSEYVVMINVTTLEGGDAFTIKHSAPGMLNTHVKGLLHAGLYEM